MLKKVYNKDKDNNKDNNHNNYSSPWWTSTAINNIKPTPTPTPANTINGILDARYLKPSNIIKDNNK